MAAYKYTVTKVTLRCGNCNTQLFHGQANRDIGSPVLRCPHCGQICRNQYRDEWDQFPNKTMVCLKPLLFPVIGALSGWIVGKSGTWAIIGAVIFALIGLGFSIADLGKISASKKRMRNPQHLEDMYALGILDEAAYKACRRKSGLQP
ncbi:MAG: hypothetical protein IJ174_05360 [Clostridia bacterium]|nr:hypothetical protein [Clostridia bacterium]